MKLLVKIDGIEVILDQERMEQLVELLTGTEKMLDHYVGHKAGDDGTNYTKTIKPYEASTDMTVRLLHDGIYTARKIRTESLGNN